MPKFQHAPIAIDSENLPPSLRLPPLRERNRTLNGSPYAVGGTLRRGFGKSGQRLGQLCACEFIRQRHEDQLFINPVSRSSASKADLRRLISPRRRASFVRERLQPSRGLGNKFTSCENFKQHFTYTL